MGQRLAIWSEGVAQYARSGATGWVYPTITALQALAAIMVVFPRARAFTSGVVAVLPTALVVRRAAMGEWRAADAGVMAVVALAAATCASTILSGRPAPSSPPP